jgi:hypothetical protein
MIDPEDLSVIQLFWIAFAMILSTVLLCICLNWHY